MTTKKSNSPEVAEVWADFNDGYINAHERDRRLAELQNYNKHPRKDKINSDLEDYDHVKD